MRCRKGDREIEVSGKAFRVIYRAQGYAAVDEVELPCEGMGEKEAEKPKNLSDMTVPELKALAKEKKLEGASSLNREELLAVLKEVI